MRSIESVYIWLLVITLVVVIGVLVYSQQHKKEIEGFLTIDEETAKAQRQMLQYEGEGRYNPFARLQSPNVSLDPDTVIAAVGQTIPVPTSRTASLLGMLGFSGLGSAAPPSAATGVEQTGAVQAKINFCESQTTVNCDMLNDPRFAECGFCHRDGLNSLGKAHRGGMYISSDDQIRANAVSNANGQAPAVYNPTVGTCKPANFTLMKENCQAREAQLVCQSAGAATSANQCGQCFGAAPAGATGLLVVGPKPRQHTVYLNVSHPGGHAQNGAGLTVTNTSTGAVATLPPSNQTLYDPKMLTLQITEGDNLTIIVAGVPKVWCGWMSSPTGNRAVSLDVGEQSISPAAGYTIAGDVRAGPVKAAFSAAGLAQPSGIPNTVLWYQRRDEAVAGMVVSAWYGVLPLSQGSAQGTDLTQIMQIAAATGQDIVVDPAPLNIPDPAPNIVKHLWVQQDNGNTQIAQDGGTLPGQSIYNTMTMAFTMPATLVDPILADDLADCPTGPLVFTEIGAGLMGSHSCFGPGGAFNPTSYCLTELFQAAGGTAQGSSFPNTAAKAAALVVNDPQSGQPSLDATMASLNNQTNIAIYGVDSNGAQVDFPTYKAAALAMLGVSVNNPCDGPKAASGPHSAECLDFLWRTSGNPGAQGDPTQQPYAYCGAAGMAAPLNADGSVNQGNVATANGYGGVGGVRQYFQGIYNRSQDSSNFDNQAAAMRSCFNINIVPQPETPAACPPPNPTEWLCVTPDMLQGPEVFYVAPGGGYNSTLADGEGICSSYGSRLATTAEVQSAQAVGADWCGWGWVADDTAAKFPVTTSTQAGCGNGSTGVMSWTPSTGLAGVNCYGVKPPQGTTDIRPFGSTWNDPTVNAVTSQVTTSSVPAVREIANQVQCASSDGQNCYTFPDVGTCQAWALTPSSNQALNDNAASPTAGIFAPSGQLDGRSPVDYLIRSRV